MHNKLMQQFFFLSFFSCSFDDLVKIFTGLTFLCTLYIHVCWEVRILVFDKIITYQNVYSAYSNKIAITILIFQSNGLNLILRVEARFVQFNMYGGHASQNLWSLFLYGSNREVQSQTLVVIYPSCCDHHCSSLINY